MVLKYNLLKKYKAENQETVLIDKYHNRFPLKVKDNYLYIYHYQNKKTEDLEKYYDMGITSLRDSF